MMTAVAFWVLFRGIHQPFDMSTSSGLVPPASRRDGAVEQDLHGPLRGEIDPRSQKPSTLIWKSAGGRNSSAGRGGGVGLETDKSERPCRADTRSSASLLTRGADGSQNAWRPNGLTVALLGQFRDPSASSPLFVFAPIRYLRRRGKGNGMAGASGLFSFGRPR